MTWMLNVLTPTSWEMLACNSVESCREEYKIMQMREYPPPPKDIEAAYCLSRYGDRVVLASEREGK